MNISHTAAPLMWGSLRLTPNNIAIAGARGNIRESEKTADGCAVDTVLEIATIDRDSKKCERDAEAMSSNSMSMTTFISSIFSPAVSEHKRLFGFKPSKSI